MTQPTNIEQLRLAEEVLLRAWRRHRDVRALYDAMMQEQRAIASGYGSPHVDPTGTLSLVELSLFVWRSAQDLRDAIRSHEEAAQDERALREQLAPTLPPGAG